MIRLLDGAFTITRREQGEIDPRSPRGLAPFGSGEQRTLVLIESGGGEGEGGRGGAPPLLLALLFPHPLITETVLGGAFLQGRVLGWPMAQERLASAHVQAHVA